MVVVVVVVIVIGEEEEEVVSTSYPADFPVITITVTARVSFIGKGSGYNYYCTATGVIAVSLSFYGVQSRIKETLDSA